MLSRSELRNLARARLRDAEALFAARRYDGAAYLCGYSVELALKLRICRTLRWGGFPSTGKEFEYYRSFRTDLEVLLHLSGVESKIMGDPHLATIWSFVGKWTPEWRYNPVGSASESLANDMIDAAATLLKAIK